MRFEVTNLGVTMVGVVVVVLVELELELVTGLGGILLFLALRLKQNGLNLIYVYYWLGTDYMTYHSARKQIYPSYHCKKIECRFQR